MAGGFPAGGQPAYGFEGEYTKHVYAVEWVYFDCYGMFDYGVRVYLGISEHVFFERLVWFDFTYRGSFVRCVFFRIVVCPDCKVPGQCLSAVVVSPARAGGGGDDPGCAGAGFVVWARCQAA